MFIMFLILSMVTTGCFIYLAMKGYSTAAGISFVIGLIFLLITTVVHYDSVTTGKVETLKSIGLEPLSTEQIYEMSRKDLDKCKRFYTFDKTYYFIVEEK